MAEIVDISSTVRNYKDLKVWQQGVELTKRIYRLTQTLPKEELYGLTSQMRRAAVSVPSNIAEGHVRQSLKEYIRHLSIATASLAELETQLLLCCDLDYATEEEVYLILEQITSIQRVINATRATLKRKLADA